MNPTLTKSFTAEAAVTKRRIVKFGATDGSVLLATGVNDALMGVAGELDATNAADRIDVHQAGIVDIEYGGTITRGDWLTSDGVGKALSAAPGAGVNNNVIGRAQLSGVVGDTGKVLLAPGRIQG